MNTELILRIDNDDVSKIGLKQIKIVTKLISNFFCIDLSHGNIAKSRGSIKPECNFGCIEMRRKDLDVRQSIDLLQVARLFVSIELFEWVAYKRVI